MTDTNFFNITEAVSYYKITRNLQYFKLIFVNLLNSTWDTIKKNFSDTSSQIQTKVYSIDSGWFSDLCGGR